MLAQYSKRTPSKRTQGGRHDVDRRRRGIVLTMAAMFFVLSIPIVGLVIDLGIQYMMQTKLQMAIDAATLAAARSLSRGNDDATQQTNAKETAQQYLTANFPQGYLGVATPSVTNLTVDESQPHVRSVSMTASTSVPLMFMSWFGVSAGTFGATSTATRRDVNVVVVMDRSGSLALSGSCSAVQNAAIGFVSKFANGTDNVGLITFATSSRQDFPLATDFNTASPNMSTIIGEVTCTGATSSAQALWQGYQALAALNQTAALNVILFFTDGQPTAVTTLLPEKAGSTCVNPGPFTGVFTVGFSGSSPAGTGGVMDYNAPAQPMSSDMILISGTEGDPTGCTFANSWTSQWYLADQDIAGVPTTDIWGNNLNNGYQSVSLAGGLVSMPSNSTGALNMINASTNAADDAAARIRAGAAPGPGLSGLTNITIFSIGLGNSAYPANGGFLERVANDPQSSSFNSAAPTGLYVFAPSAADLSDAFSRVASEILRLAK